MASARTEERILARMPTAVYDRFVDTKYHRGSPASDRTCPKGRTVPEVPAISASGAEPSREEA